MVHHDSSAVVDVATIKDGGGGGGGGGGGVDHRRHADIVAVKDGARQRRPRQKGSDRRGRVVRHIPGCDRSIEIGNTESK